MSLHPGVRRRNGARLKRIGAGTGAVARGIAARVVADPAPTGRRAIATSIPGVSTVAADAPIALAPAHGALKR